jgi:hypothetical protein
VIGIIMVYFGHYRMPDIHLLQNVIIGAIFYIVAAIIGVVIGLLVFLGAIMKT